MTTASSAPLARSREQQIAQILLFATPAMFATNMLLARYTADFIPPVALAVWRWLGVCVLLLPFCGGELWRQRRAVLHDAPKLLVLGGLGMGICGALVYAAGQTTTATNIGLIYAVSPVFIILLTRAMFGERLSRRQMAGTILALGGTLLIVAKGHLESLLSLRFVPGDLMILVAAASWAVYSVLLKRWPGNLSINGRLAAIALAGVITMLPFLGWEMAVVGTAHPDARTLAIIAILILVPGIGAYATHGYITRHLGPSKGGLILYLAPVYTSLLAWLLLGERIAAYHWIGAALVLSGLYIATTRTRKA